MQIRDLRNGEWSWVNNAVVTDPHISAHDCRVYLVLASFSGMPEIRPSFETIAERSIMSVRQVKESIKKIIDLGFVSISQGGGRGRSNVYKLLKITKGCRMCTVSKLCKSGPETVQMTTVNGAGTALHKDIKKDKEETYILDVGNKIFEAWWAEFPASKRNVKKDQACRKFRKEAKTDTDLIGRLARLQDQKQIDRKWLAGFIPNMSTYLNQERWNLEVELERSSNFKSYD